MNVAAVRDASAAARTRCPECGTVWVVGVDHRVEAVFCTPTSTRSTTPTRWFVFDNMAEGHRGEDVPQAVLERIATGQPPRVEPADEWTTWHQWMVIVHTEVSIIASLYLTVSIDTSPAEIELRREAIQIIEDPGTG